MPKAWQGYSAKTKNCSSHEAGAITRIAVLNDGESIRIGHASGSGSPDHHIAHGQICVPPARYSTVTTDVSPDKRLVFQVKTRGEQIDGEDDDYLLLQILHEKAYVLFIPVSKEKGDLLLIYSGESAS